MKNCLSILVLLSLLPYFSLFSQDEQQVQDVDFDLRDKMDLIFSGIPTSNFPSGYFFGRLPDGATASKKFLNHRNESSSTFYDWLSVYNELYFACINREVDSNFLQLLRQVKQKTTTDSVLVIGLLDISFEDMDTVALQTGRVYEQNEVFFEDQSKGISPWITDSLMVVCFMKDSISQGENKIVFDDQYFFQNRNMQITEITINMNDGSEPLILHSGDAGNLNFKYKGEQEVTLTFTYSNGMKKHASTVVNVGTQRSLFSSDFPPDFSTTVTFDADYDCPPTFAHLTPNSVKYDVGVWYHSPCQPGNNFIRKPFIVVTGFGPFDHFGGASVGNSAYESGNLSGFFDALRADGYDIIIIDNRYGGDCVQHNAEIVIKTLNMINGHDQTVPELIRQSHFENVLLTQSLGAIAARYALAKMEKEHYYDPANHPHHECRLWISHEGEMQGGSVLLGFQQYVTNLLAFGPYIILNRPLLTSAIIYAYANAEVVNSHTAKQLLNYHRSQNFLTQTAGHHPFRTQLLHELANDLNHPGTINAGYPTDCRSICVSNGNSDGSAIPYIAGERLFDMNFDMTWYYIPLASFHVEYSAVKNVDNFITFKYSMQEHNIQVPLITRKVDFAEELESVPGSSFAFHSTNCQAFNDLLSWANFIPGFSVHGNCAPDMFVPTVSTLDLQPASDATAGTNHWWFDVKNSLLPYIKQQIQHNDKLYGYPHINFPINHQSIMPFDAFFVSDIYEEHVTDKTFQIQQFLMDEIEPRRMDFDSINNMDTLFIQNQLPHGFVELEHRNTIVAGKNVTSRMLSGLYKINPGGWLNLSAKNKVILSSGFRSMRGSSLHVQNNTVYNCEKIDLFWEGNGVPNYRSSSSRQNKTFVNKKSDRSNIIQSDIDLPHSVLIIPNPNNGVFKVSSIYSQKIYPLQLEIFNNLGIKLFDIESSTQFDTFDLNLSPGMYIIVIKNSKWSSSEKFMVY